MVRGGCSGGGGDGGGSDIELAKSLSFSLFRSLFFIFYFWFSFSFHTVPILPVTSLPNNLIISLSLNVRIEKFKMYGQDLGGTYPLKKEVGIVE